MPMQELVVPVFREAGAPERDETPLRSTRRPSVYPPEGMFHRGEHFAPEAQMRALNYDQAHGSPVGGGFVGQSE